MVSPSDNANWAFDYGLIEDIPVPGGDLPSLDPLWSSPSLSVEFDDSLGSSQCLRDNGSRKRVRPGSCSGLGSKACREKMRRDKLNDRFMELGALLDPGRPPKMDKSVILADAMKMVNQLRAEAQKLKESNENLQEKVNELKVEKNELRDEKQRLKTEKESIERQVNALSASARFLPHLPAIPAPFSSPSQVIGSKLVPIVGYPGVPMWQLMPPATVDTSQDPVLRSPAA
ncbi:transcription factor ILR3 [Ricinus communis]|uniref:DNA binding protein, putative n=1 Tax=Ricinus communis TaxID=3988 RepID=B9RXU9_RICCO|nr:transcription factor ILR3 [Ricinus communis]XP_048230045.1 transcription factor ILR3 [Ricinus communis]EEF43955.1 DNA binding protein, putative [Ricinus communis]|eukprot:XP_002518568.1 transcription factor ILR3 [Ricinus communis]